MRNYGYSRAAAGDLEEIWEYIAKDNVEAADRVQGEIEAALDLLANNPYLGHSRPDLTPLPVRFWAVRSYLIIYRPRTRPLEVARILHAARDVSKLI